MTDYIKDRFIKNGRIDMSCLTKIGNQYFDSRTGLLEFYEEDLLFLEIEKEVMEI